MKKKLRSLYYKLYLVFASIVTGRPRSEIRADMKKARKRFKVTRKEYFKEKMYRMSYAEIVKLKAPPKKPKKKKPNIDVELAAELKGVSYAEAKAEMDALKQKYGMTYSEYNGERIFECRTEAEITERINAYVANNEKYIKIVSDDKGWTYDEAKAELDRVKSKYGYKYNQYSINRMGSMTDDEIAQFHKEHRDIYGALTERAVSESGMPREAIRRHMKRCFVLYGLQMSVYVALRAWEMSDEELSKFVSYGVSRIISDKYNDREQSEILSNKSKFNELYKDYTGRKFWVNRDTSFEEFCEFIDGQTEIFCKPVDSMDGIGAERRAVGDDLRAMYDELMAKDRLLAEECIVQHHEISEFTPICVCTIRVLNLRDESGIKTLFTAMRFGNEGVTDNFSNCGMVTDVDPETGIIRTDAVDKQCNVYEVHPVSGKRFKGFKVPNWDKVLEITKSAMQVLDGVNFVGWDVAVCEDKAIIIEGNTLPYLGLIQAPYIPERKGMRYLFEPYL